MLVVWWIIIPRDFESWITYAPEHSIILLGIFFSVIFVSSIPDYFSYLKTRLILARMAKISSITWVCALALADIILSYCIFVIGGSIFYTAIDKIFYGEPVLPTFLAFLISGFRWENFLSMVTLQRADRLTPSLGIFFVRELICFYVGRALRSICPNFESNFLHMASSCFSSGLGFRCDIAGTFVGVLAITLNLIIAFIERVF